MDIAILPIHKKRISEIYEHLHTLRSDENSFFEVEGLFYEVLSISRNYGNDEKENSMLSVLKDLERNEYIQTQKKYAKSRQREIVIKRFKNLFKKRLNPWF